MHESNDDIFERLIRLTHVDAAICKMLMMACAAMKDDDTAEHLLKRVRDHLAITEDADKMYNTEYYLSYVKDLMDLADGFKAVRPVKLMHEKVRDTYEILLYNKNSLDDVLLRLQKQERKAAMRENYWKN